MQATFNDFSIVSHFLQVAQGQASALTRVKAKRAQNAVSGAIGPVQEELQSLAQRVGDEGDEMTPEQAAQERSELLREPIEAEVPEVGESLLSEAPATVFEDVARRYVDHENVARIVNENGRAPGESWDDAIERVLQVVTRRLADDVVSVVTRTLFS